jgi:hypothetical protein
VEVSYQTGPTDEEEGPVKVKKLFFYVSDE